ncbi:hypothetical protein GIB67_042736 [Kingdonia uniflora]|uniref:Uncharacterized protein n=1 Tax=Kingdonia uniflora TaxID=39325 RepID=A0A7J7L198_9MAGN|nr:hypothetical protein GIB67_042736 [Kingdonia uniflora]
MDVPKGHLAVYVGENEKKRAGSCIQISYLNQPPFQELLSWSTGEFGFTHPKGDITLPCNKTTSSISLHC